VAIDKVASQPVSFCLRIPRLGAAMTRETRVKLKYAIAALAAMCIALVCVSIVFLRGGDSDGELASPFQISGVWSVADLRGAPMGTITFSPDGEFDDGEYVGRWSLRDGCIHVQAWEGEPALRIRYLFPKVDEVVLVPQFDEENDAWILQNENVTLTRQPDGT